jgi:hypothetical protein
MSQKVTDEATAAASLHSTVVRDVDVSHQTFSQLDKTCANTIVPKESSGSEFVKDESDDTNASSGTTVPADVGFLLKTAGICLAHFFLVCCNVNIIVIIYYLSSERTRRSE